VSEVGQDGVFVVERIARQAHRAEARRPQSPVPQSIGIEGCARAVRASPSSSTIRPSRPYEVSLVALDPDAAPRRLDPVSLEEREESILQLRPCPVQAPSSQLQQLRAAATRVVMNDSFEGGHVESVQVFRLRDHPLQCLALKNISQVQEGPGHGCHGNPTPHRHVLGPKPARPVNANPGAAAPFCDGTITSM